MPMDPQRLGLCDAFPSIHQDTPETAGQTGMTYRHYMATHIFAGMMSNGELAGLVAADPDHFPAFAAKGAVKAADALLAELAR